MAVRVRAEQRGDVCAVGHCTARLAQLAKSTDPELTDPGEVTLLESRSHHDIGHETQYDVEMARERRHGDARHIGTDFDLKLGAKTAKNVGQLDGVTLAGP